MSWSKIHGHEHLIESFRHVVARGRLAHAYLFSGPTGVGKRLFAQELAKALLCEAPDRAVGTLEACDRCAACALVDAGTHPDLFSVRRPEEKNEFPIALMQELCAGFAMKAARGHGKVGILDDADDLNPEAANCFLKTLEEPPPRSVFMLVGTSADRQLPTIQSRCQVVRFAPLPANDVAAILKGHGIHDAKLVERVVRLADGSPGQALALGDPALWEFRKQLLDGLTRPKIDTLGLAKSFTQFVEGAGKDAPPQRRRALVMLRLLIEAFTSALSLSLDADGKSIGAEDLPILQSLTRRASTEKILAALERCLQTEEQINRYVQVSLVLEGLIDALGQLLEDGAPIMAAR